MTVASLISSYEKSGGPTDIELAVECIPVIAGMDELTRELFAKIQGLSMLPLP
jgi:hypothetical protein